eukprot:8092182-Karenia_brevis.AAC.1
MDCSNIWARCLLMPSQTIRAMKYQFTPMILRTSRNVRPWCVWSVPAYAPGIWEVDTMKGGEHWTQHDIAAAQATS